MVQPLYCCLASWQVYYSMLLSVNLARSFSLSVSFLSVHFHYESVKEGPTFQPFPGGQWAGGHGECRHCRNHLSPVERQSFAEGKGKALLSQHLEDQLKSHLLTC